MNALNVTLGFILTTVAYAGASPACGNCGDKKCGHAPAQAEAKSATREEPADAHGKETEKEAHAAGEAGHDHDGCDHAQEKPAAEAGHAHGAACDHGDADEPDAKPKTADKPEPEHARGVECDHDHEAAEKPAAAEAGHMHGAACDHDPEAAKKPAAAAEAGHAHAGEACDGTHAAAAEAACSHSEAGEAGAIELSESALWCHYCAGLTDSGAEIAPNDPNWDRLQYRQGNFLGARAFVQRREALGEVGADMLELATAIEEGAGDRAAAERYRSRLREQFPDHTPNSPEGTP